MIFLSYIINKFKYIIFYLVEADPFIGKVDQDIIDRLGVQAQEAARQVSNQEIMLSELENTRLSISGVSLDEEMANLIQFQHAYSANAKMISTLDELLDVVINGLKR